MNTANNNNNNNNSGAEGENMLRNLVWRHILIPAGYDNMGHPILAVHPANLPDPIQVDYSGILSTVNEGLHKYLPHFHLIWTEATTPKYRPSLSLVDDFLRRLNGAFFDALAGFTVVGPAPWFEQILAWLREHYPRSAEFEAKIRRVDDEARLLGEMPGSALKPTVQVASRLFGEPLAVLQPDGGIPPPITQMIGWLAANALHCDGIFRRSADAQTLESVKSYLNANRPLDYAAFHDANDIACVLKMFVRELPEPLIPAPLYPFLIDPADYSEPAVAIDLVRQNILARLPPQKHLLLKQLMWLLNRVAREEATNRMGARNLAICWSPNLVVAEGVEEQMRYMKTSQATVCLMISEYDAVFA